MWDYCEGLSAIYSIHKINFAGISIMPGYTKVSIILKDAPNHVDYNKRIIEYLNDRHSAINDNMFTVAIDVADDANINDFVLEGIESVPAMKVFEDEPFIYGVNSILSTLAKLEIIDNKKAGAATKPSESQDNFTSKADSGSESFYDMVMEEMKCEDQEDPDSPSTLKAYNQDVPESPLTDKSIEEKAKRYNQIYEQRRKRNGGRAPPKQSKGLETSNTKVNVDAMIAKGGYDKGEEMFMRQIAQNLS